MSYGRFVNAGLLVRSIPADGYVPIIETDPETPEGYRAIFHYEDKGDFIAIVWEYIELTDEEKAEIDSHDEASVDDYENALANFGVRV